MARESRLATLRKSRGVSQAKFARQVGISASAVAMYETGRRIPSQPVAERMAEYLGVSLDELQRASALPANQATSEGRAYSKGHAIPEGRATQYSHAEGAEPAEELESVAELRRADETDPSTDPNQISLPVTREEANVLLSMRMNPRLRLFILNYLSASEEEREQLDRTWRVIQSFRGHMDTN